MALAETSFPWPLVPPTPYPPKASLVEGRLHTHARALKRVGQLPIGAFILVGGHHGDDRGACWLILIHACAELGLGELWPAVIDIQHLDHHLGGRLRSKVRSILGATSGDLVTDK